MNLLYITNGICGVGGLERVLSIKASYLAEKFNFEVTIISLNEENKKPFYEFSSKIYRYNINVNLSSKSYFFQYIKEIREAVKQIQPDIISVCDDGLKGFFLPLILKKPCPVIYERHVSKLIALNGRKETIKDKLIFSLMKIGGRTFDKFVVLTGGNKLEWQGLKNLEMIPNPLSFYPAENSTLNSKKIIGVGKITYQKGYDLLLNVWKLIFEKYPDCSIHIYGGTFDNGKLNQQIEESKIERFEIHPPTNEIENIYSDASIFAFPSRFEGFGMVLTEAMAYGVPCVSFDCPHGPADIITNDKDGFLVSNGDITDFADKLSLLIENDEKRKQMGTEAKKNVKRYLPEVIIARWDELFKSMS